MKQYFPLRMQPNTNQFFDVTRGRLSEQGSSSPAGRAVRHLFSAAEALYRVLSQSTSNRLSVFVDSGRYLTPTQEHDLLSLTAAYVEQLKTSEIHWIVNEDRSISEEDRSVLKAALDLFESTAQTASVSLGTPQWIEPT